MIELLDNKLMEAFEEFMMTIYCCLVDGCSKEYKSKFNLKKHIQVIHCSVKPFQCSICKQTFVCKKNLKEHMFIHSGAKPYKCSYCAKKFRQLSQLTLHRRQHGKKYTATLQVAKSICEN